MLWGIKRLKNMQSWAMSDGQIKCSSVLLTQRGVQVTCHQQEEKRMGLICILI